MGSPSEMNHGFRVGDKALRRDYNPPHEINKVAWIEFTVNETYMDLIDQFPEDYRTIDGGQWIKNKIVCDVCGFVWRALYVDKTPMLQCPHCKQMTYKNILE